MGRPRDGVYAIETLERRVLLSAALGHGRGNGRSLRDIAPATTADPSAGAAPSVVGRWLFYNQSAFDGNDASANPADDAAIATDKSALLPGGTAQTANFTSYSKGVNGLMIDIANAPGAMSIADFAFSIGSGATGSSWTTAPAPSALLVRTDTPSVGTTRVEFTWANNAIANEWLKVTVKADAATGLSSPDVFYFGNLTGSAMLAPMQGLFIVSGADAAAANGDLHPASNPADVTNTHDFNRDKIVDTTDSAIATNSASAFNTLAQLVAPSTAPPPAVSVVGRFLFYNGSVWDAGNTSITPADDSAIPPDKHPLLPGGFAQFPNISNYVQGINGLMIDIAGLTATPTLSDFNFQLGNVTTLSQWTAAPAPSAMLVRPGDGVGGSTRVEFAWANGSITNQWLSVTTLADANTGLVTPDVFYYGSLVGFSTGAADSSNTQFRVTQADAQYAREDLHNFANPAAVGNAHDYNRDGKVDAADEIIAGIGATRGLSLVNLDFGTTVWSPAIIITQGGTYTGNWQSLDSNTPAVAIDTTQPVTIISSSVRGMGDLIVSGVAGVNLTVIDTTGISLNANHIGIAPGRFVTVDGFATVDVENNTLVSTAGIELNNYGGGPNLVNPVKVYRNRAVNIDGRYSNGAGGFSTNVNDFLAVQFLQITGSPQMPGADIAFNQVVNLPNQSRVEDNISIFKSGGTQVSPILIHDNYIQGAYPIDPAHNTNFTGGGIMLADGMGATLATDPANIRAYNNIVVGTSNYGIAISSGHDNVIYNNTVISSGLLPDGTAIAYVNVGIYIWNSGKDPFFSRNVAFNNVVGFAVPGGRNDYWLPDCALQFGNTSLAGPVTLGVETDYFITWLQKLSTTGFVVGRS